VNARRDGHDGRDRAKRGNPQNRGSTQNRGSNQNRSNRASRSAARVSAARLVAYDVLRDVDEREAYANLALPSRIREARLTPRDAALATELVAGTLRGRGRYDRIIALAAGRDIEQIDARTRNVLRLGAHQLLRMRTASHAAVNESVELQRTVGNQAAAGFVNGVLRAIGRTSDEEWDQRISEAAPNPDQALADRSSHPAWVVRAFRDALASEGRADELPQLLDSDNTAPRVSLALMPGADIDPETAEAIGAEHGVRASGPSPTGLELDGGDPLRAIETIGLDAGLVRVQDQGSQLAALALTRVPLPGVAAGGANGGDRRGSAPERWLDLCAGPGGKTAVLAAEAALVGASVRANEVADHRAYLVRRAVVAHEQIVEVVNFDGRDDAAYGGADARFERILLDAPCSGLGALRRRPEARWRKQPSDLPELTTLQGELLDAAIAHLAPGGVLAYVTCSPHRAETRMVVDDALRRHDGLHELDARAAVNAAVESGGRDPLELAGSALSAQLWPHRHGTDAMFVALLARPEG